MAIVRIYRVIVEIPEDKYEQMAAMPGFEQKRIEACFGGQNVEVVTYDDVRIIADYTIPEFAECCEQRLKTLFELE